MFWKGSYRNFYQDAYVGIIPKRFCQNVIRMFRVELCQKGSVRMLSECSARNVVGRFILTFSAPFQNDSIRFPGTFWGRSGYKYSERCADWVIWNPSEGRSMMLSPVLDMLYIQNTLHCSCFVLRHLLNFVSMAGNQSCNTDRTQTNRHQVPKHIEKTWENVRRNSPFTWSKKNYISI